MPEANASPKFEIILDAAEQTAQHRACSSIACESQPLDQPNARI
jgi:hypothetical protein